MAFSTNGTERMRISSTGNVGIGTSSPSVNAHIAGSLPFTYIDNSAATGGTYGLKLTAGATQLVDFTYSSITGENRIGGLQSYVFPTFYSGGSERMRIDSSGNVGIGVTPTNESGYKTLEMGAGTTGSIIKLNSTTAGHYHRILNNNGQMFIQADQGNNTGASAIIFNVDGPERMRIDSSGNLLVGTTSTTIDISTNASGLLYKPSNYLCI